MLKKFIYGALLFGASAGLFAAPNPSRKPVATATNHSKYEISYMIKLPALKKANGEILAERDFPVYRLPNDRIIPNVVKIKTKNIESLSSDSKGFNNSTLQSDLVKYNIESVRAPYQDFYKHTKVEDKNNLKNIYEVVINSSSDIYAVCQELMKNPDIEYAMPVYVPHVSDFTPNDPDRGYQYMIDAMKLPQAWEITKGSKTVKIAIVDSGVETDHPDLADQIWTNPNESVINGVDDDGNGKVDDIHGWDFVAAGSTTTKYKEDNNTTVMPRPTSETDERSHGTHVAGCAAASTNNSVGISSPSFNCSIIPVKCGFDTASSYSGSIYRGYEGILYAAQCGADIINCSWGGAGYAAEEESIVEQATELGSLVVVAAGNDGTNNDIIPTYPACFTSAMTVGAVNSGDSLTSYTNYGYGVTVFAPGDSIYSTIPSKGYGKMSGTSMASPTAAGVAALVKSMHSDWTPEQVKKQMRVTCDSFPSFSFTPLAYGTVNAYKAVTYNQTFTSDDLMPGLTLRSSGLVEKSAIPLGVATIAQVKFQNILGNAGSVNVTFVPVDAGVSLKTSTFSYTNFTNNKIDSVNLEVTLSSAFPWYDGVARFYVYFSNASGYRDVEYMTLPVSISTKNKKTVLYTPDSPITLNAMCGGADTCYGFGYYKTYYQMFATINKSSVSYSDLTSYPTFYALANPSSKKLVGGATSYSAKETYIYKGEASSQAWSWSKVATTSATTPFINDIFFFNANEGLMLGDPLTSGGKFAASKTTNGGTTWTTITTLPKSLSSEGGITGAATRVGDSVWFGTNSGRVIYSTDKGASWTVKALPRTNIVSSIAFLNATQGLVLSIPTDKTTEPFIVYYTADGGATWTKKASITNDAFAPAQLLANGAKFYYLCDNSAVMSSTDNGLTWVPELTLNNFGVTKGYGILTSSTNFRLWMGGVSFGYLDVPVTPISSVPYDFSNATSDLLVYPNPAMNNITLNKELTNAYVVIFDSRGQLVLNFNNYSSSMIDVSNLASGAYTIGIVQDGKTCVGKLAIVR